MSATRLNIAIVAPSMGILGGQAVQASRLIRAWRDDPDVLAWLVPINPIPPYCRNPTASEIRRSGRSGGMTQPPQ